MLLLQQILTSALRQALPSAPAISHILTQVKAALFWSVLTAMLLAALIIMAAYGLYLFLVMEGVGTFLALSLTGVMLVFGFVIAALIAHLRITKLAELGELSSPHGPDMGELSELVQAFMEGFSAPTSDQRSAAKPPIQPEAAIDPVGMNSSQNT